MVSVLWGFTGIFLVPRDSRTVWRCLYVFVAFSTFWWLYWTMELMVRTGLFRSANAKGPFEKDDSVFFNR